MAQLVLIVLGAEKAMRAQHHKYHLLWCAGKLVKCARMAGQRGWLNW